MLFLSKPVSYIIQYLVQNSKFSTFTIAKKYYDFSNQIFHLPKNTKLQQPRNNITFSKCCFCLLFSETKTLKYTFPKPQPDFLENDRTTYAKNFQFIIDTWASDDYSMTIITAKWTPTTRMPDDLLAVNANEFHTTKWPGIVNCISAIKRHSSK